VRRLTLSTMVSVYTVAAVGVYRPCLLFLGAAENVENVSNVSVLGRKTVAGGS
jgi:hypothetical protein